ILLQMAELYRHRGQPRRALSTLDYLTDRYPPGEEPGYVYYLKGLAYLALKRYHNAAEVLLTATQRGETTAEAYYRLGEAHLLAGQTTAARVALAQAIARQPDHQPSRLLLARIAHGTGGLPARHLR
ncbi:MAG: tetratricopeptide repeat protein, partial [Pirellulales bacterium]